MAKFDKRSDLIRIAGKVARERLVISGGGNISARAGRYIYISPKGACLDSCPKSSYVRVSLDSGRVSGGVPSSELYMHLACYGENSGIGAVMHLHPVFSTAVANSRIKLAPVSYELLSCLGSEMVRARYKPAGSGALAREVGAFIKRYNAILLPNHGLLTVGRDLDEAFERARTCERACQTLIFSKLLGLHTFLPRKEANRIIALYRTR